MDLIVISFIAFCSVASMWIYFILRIMESYTADLTEEEKQLHIKMAKDAVSIYPGARVVFIKFSDEKEARKIDP